MPADLSKVTVDPSAAEALFKALGRAMAYWQYVESGLYIIAHCVLGCEARHSSIAFFQIKSPDSKVKLVDQLCETVLSAAVYKNSWVPARKRVSKYLEARNYMAHFEAQLLPHDKMAPHTKYNIAIAPHHLEPRSLKGGNVTVLFVETLQKVGDDFVALAEELVLFGERHIPHWQQRVALLPPNLQLVLQTMSKTASARAPGTPPRRPLV